MSIAVTRLFHARWTEQIHEEWMENLLENRKDITREQLDRVRLLMNNAIPDCVVTGYEHLIEVVELPDPNDRHVLAAAIHADVNVIVTVNGGDFPDEELVKHGIEKCPPDAFISRLLDEHSTTVIKALNRQRDRLANPKPSADQFLDALARQGLVRTAEMLAPHRDLL